MIGLNSNAALLFALMPLFAAGASTLPTLLGHITDQVGTLPCCWHSYTIHSYYEYCISNVSLQVAAEEVGAVQGAAETLRTLATFVGYKLSSKVFAHFLSEGRSAPQAALFVSSAFSIVAFAVTCIAKC